MTFLSPPAAPRRVRRGEGGGVPREQLKSGGRPGGCGTVESLGTELGEERAESRRGRTFPWLIAEGGLSHGVHVRALPRLGKESLENQHYSKRKFTVGGSSNCQEGGGGRTPPFLPKGAETSEFCAGSCWSDQGPWHEFEFPVSSSMSPQPEPQTLLGRDSLTTRWPIGTV